MYNNASWFRLVLAGLFYAGAVGAGWAQLPELWKGVVLVAGGQVEGKWSSVEGKPKTMEEWADWEVNEKMLRPEQLRRTASPLATLLPDAADRCVLVIAPEAGLRGMVVDAGTGLVDVRGAFLRQSILRLAAGGQAVITDSHLSSFHVVESTGDKGGGSIFIDRCGISGGFGGVFQNGAQRWVVRRSHFREARLPWVSRQAANPPVVVDCHFEKCYVPESFLAVCQDCTFDDCIIGRPESFTGNAGRSLVLTETGTPSRFMPRAVGTLKITTTPGTARSVFWGGWLESESGPLTAANMSSAQVAKAVELGNTLDLPEVTEKAVRRRIFKRMDGAEWVSFQGNQIQTQELGLPGPVLGTTARRGHWLEWTQELQRFTAPDAAGKPARWSVPVKRQAVFNKDFSTMVVLDEVPGQAPDVVRVFRQSGTTPPGSLGIKMAGTIWRLDGPDRVYLRFDNTSHLTWAAQAPDQRGGSLWRTLRADGYLVIADWQGSPARVTLEQNPARITLTSARGTWEGYQVRQDEVESFASLNYGEKAPAQTAPFLSENGSPLPAPTPPATPVTPPAPPAPEPAKPTDNVVAANKETPAPDKTMADPPPADPGTATPPAAPVPATVPAGPPLVSQTSRVNGLLVSVLPGGKTAGATSMMNATAIPSGSTGESTLEFNQKIGPEMEKALAEVRKFQTIRQGNWTRGYKIEVSFADKYVPKDGPSAAVACALLLEGLFTGKVWDSTFAVTGDLNADGSVQPVGGVPAKIKGAINRRCRIIGIPAANTRSVRDYMVAEGPHVLMGINIFTLKEFDRARDLALTVKPEKTALALAEFDKIVNAGIAPERAAAWLKMPAVIAQLEKVLKAAPDHLSARLLYDFAIGRDKLIMSLAGSIECIDREASDLLNSVKESALEIGKISGIKKDSLGGAVFRLRRLRAQLHPQTRPLLDSMETFSTTVRTIFENPPRTAGFIDKARNTIIQTGSAVQSEYQRLRNDPAVVAELMNE